MNSLATRAYIGLGVLATLVFSPVLLAQTANSTATAPSAPAATALSPTPQFPAGLWELSHENDWFIYSDRDYTGGLRMAYTTPNYSNWDSIFLIPSGLGNFSDKLSLIDSSWATVSAAIYAQINIYTPEATQLRTPNPNDHPYAGWVGLATDLIRQTDTRRSIQEINVGLVGPESGAQDLQQSFHQFIHSTDPLGWDHQIKNEPVFQYTNRQDWRIPALSNLNNAVPVTFGFDNIAHGTVTVGNGWDYAAVGALARFGYHLPMDFGPARLRLGDVDTMPYQPGGSAAGSIGGWSLEQLSAYVYFGAEGRAVARDITLDGNTFARSASVNKEPLVGEFYSGLAVGYGHFRGSFMVLYETNTFRAQAQTGQWRGILTLGVAF